MQSLGRYYVRYINTTYKRTSALWEGRFKSTIVDSERYLLTVYRYIELNPVRAAMVNHAADYSWSSYQSNALGKTIELIKPHLSYMILGSSSVTRRAVYQEMFKGHMSENTLNEISDSTNKGWILGGERFKQKIDSMANRRLDSYGHGGDRKSGSFKCNAKSITLTP